MKELQIMALNNDRNQKYVEEKFYDYLLIVITGNLIHRVRILSKHFVVLFVTHVYGETSCSLVSFPKTFELPSFNVEFAT